jgi:hypothetical protein
MVARCTNPKHRAYKSYGGRGITVCARWRSFTNFLADMGEKPEGLSLDRIDYNGNYEPDNCRWATDKQQARNKRNSSHITLNGETHTISEWAEILHIHPATISDRLQHGYTAQDALYPGKYDSNGRPYPL